MGNQDHTGSEEDNSIKIFITTYCAIKVSGPMQIIVKQGHISITAHASRKDALESALSLARQECPEEDGWTGHEPSASELTHDTLVKALELLEE
jgi:hypothetical protein